MTIISTVKKLAASTALAGSLGIVALSLGTAVAAAAPSTDSGSSASQASTGHTKTTSDSSSPSSASGPTDSPTSKVGSMPTSISQQVTSLALQNESAFQTRVSQLKTDYAAGRITGEEFSDQLQAANQAHLKQADTLSDLQQQYDQQIIAQTRAMKR